MVLVDDRNEDDAQTLEYRVTAPGAIRAWAAALRGSTRSSSIPEEPIGLQEVQDWIEFVPKAGSGVSIGFHIHPDDGPDMWGPEVIRLHAYYRALAMQRKRPRRS